MNQEIVIPQDIAFTPPGRQKVYLLSEQDFDILWEGNITTEQSFFFSFLGSFISSLVGLIGFLSTVSVQSRNNAFSIILWTMTLSTLLLSVFAAIMWIRRRKSNVYKKLKERISLTYKPKNSQ